VLKPGGQLTVLEFSRPVLPGFRQLYQAYSLYLLPRIGGWISGDPSAYSYLPDSIRTFPDQAALAEELRAAGFAEVGWTNLSGGVVALHRGCRPWG
jgi:demethylmenaquinone methyltransferase / 2-methoxy-6-polyprenyl-1,4-benzoquinol methylase